MAFTPQAALFLLLIFGLAIVYVAKAGDSWDTFIFSLKALGLLISVLAVLVGMVVLLYLWTVRHPVKL